jgi:HK97 family phage prohead protease
VPEKFARGALDPADVIGRPLLWSHDRNEPIGHVVTADDTPVGLTVTAVVQPTSRGSDAITLLRSGSLRGLSIGFEAQEVKQRAAGVTITKARLAELSVTPLPAYANAVVTATRDEENPMPDTPSDVTATRDQVDLSPLSERLDQIESRMAAQTRTAELVPVTVTEAFVAGLRDLADTRKVRALADVVSSGNSGVLPQNWQSEVIGYLDARRNLMAAAGSVGFPASGTSLTFPAITQRTTVAARGAEKTEIPSQALTTGWDVYTAAYFAGGVDIALELIAQSDPGIYGLVVNDLLDQYAIASEAAFVASTEAAAAAAGAALPVDSYANFIAAVIATSADIRAATGVPGDLLALTTASWQAVLGMVDGDTRRVLATSGAVNADGAALFTAESVNIGGINCFHSPASTADVQFNSKSLRVAEKPPMTLTVDNVALMGRDVGVLGATIALPLYPAGIVSYTV